MDGWLFKETCFEVLCHITLVWYLTARQAGRRQSGGQLRQQGQVRLCPDARVLGGRQLQDRRRQGCPEGFTTYFDNTESSSPQFNTPSMQGIPSGGIIRVFPTSGAGGVQVFTKHTYKESSLQSSSLLLVSFAAPFCFAKQWPA